MDPSDDHNPRQPPPQQQESNQNLAQTTSGHDWVDVDLQSDAATVGDNRALSPAPPQPDTQPVTPAAVSDVGGEYFETEPFPTISNVPAPSNQSARGTSFGPGRSHASSSNPPPPSSLLALEGTTSRIPRQPSIPSIRIRRRGTSTGSNRPGSSGGSNAAGGRPGIPPRATSTTSDSNRPRSISQPERSYAPNDVSNIARHSRRAAPQAAMPRLTEEGARPTMQELGMNEPLSPTQSLPEESMGRQDLPQGADGSRRGVRRKVSRFFWPGRGKQEDQQSQSQMDAEEAERAAAYDDALVDYLDTIDPEVQTLSTLTNVQNSLFVPNVGHWLNRRPTYNLSQHDAEIGQTRPLLPGKMGTVGEERVAEAEATDAQEDRPAIGRSSTITSRLTESHYAALPHGASLEGWTMEEKMELDDHVRHMLHSRRSKFKRRMKGFGQYVRRPLGFLVTLYATLITLFGLAWVLFLIGWIYVGEKQVYVIHVIDSVLVALFLVMGGGLAPFRAVDTYHTGWILYYAHLVKKAGKRNRNRLRKKSLPPDVEQSIRVNSAVQGEEPGEAFVRTTQETEAPEEADEENADAESSASNDPHTMRNNVVDVEDAKSGILAYENTPLTPKQQKRLHHHQMKLAKSHTYYKPQETFTHYAFPLNYLIAIIVLCDAHSCLQIALSSTTWGIDYRTRPFALTTVILCVSITCNITAGVIISIGDRKTRKKDVFSLMNRQELTGDAMKAIEQKRSKDSKSKSGAESESELDSRSSRMLSKPPTDEALQEAKVE